MPRVKSNVARLKRKNKVMKLAKGYWGGRSKPRTNAVSRSSKPSSWAARPVLSPIFSKRSPRWPPTHDGKSAEPRMP